MSTPTRDLHDNLSPISMIDAAVLAADNTPTVIDLRGYQSAMVMIWAGAGGITFSGTNKIEFVLEHSTDNSTWAAVAQSDVVGTTVASGGIVRSFVAAKAAADTTATKMSYIGARRYIRLTADFSGTHGTGTAIAAFAVRGNPDLLPTT